MENKILEIFEELFSTPKNIDVSLLIYNEYEGWDSVGHMTLVGELENKFDCMLEMDDILDMSSFTKIVEIMNRVTSNG
jgi:acyl carrier protein